MWQNENQSTISLKSKQHSIWGTLLVLLLLLKSSCSQKILKKCYFQMGGGNVCVVSDQLHLLPTQKHQLGFISAEGWLCFSQHKCLCILFMIFFLQVSLHPVVKEGTCKRFQCHLQTGFCILTFPQIKKMQLSSYHLIQMLFNPPLPSFCVLKLCL